jgi:hypothetical protein
MSTLARALLHVVMRHNKRVKLGQLLATGHHGRGTGQEAVRTPLDIVGLDVLRAELADDSSGCNAS